MLGAGNVGAARRESTLEWSFGSSLDTVQPADTLGCEPGAYRELG